MHCGLVILGDPGSGKSTLLRYQALRAAALRATQGEERTGVPPALLPIFVPLAAYDSHLHRGTETCSLGEFLSLYYDRWHSLPGLAPLFRQALETGRAVVLLDGLDEVLDTAQRQFVAEQAGALMRQWASRGNRFVVTSRIVGYRDLAQSILTANSPHEAILYRDLFLTAALAADGVGLSPTVLDTLTQQLQPLQDSPIPTVRDTALAGLAQLARLEHEPALTLLLASLHQAALQIHVMRAAKAVLEAEACALLRQGFVARLAAADEDVRQAAVEALAALVGSDAGVRQALLAALAAADYRVREAAVRALAALVGSDAEITLHLLPWLGTVDEPYFSADTATATRRFLATTYAACLVPGSILIEQVAAMLSAPA